MNGHTVAPLVLLKIPLARGLFSPMLKRHGSSDCSVMERAWTFLGPWLRIFNGPLIEGKKKAPPLQTTLDSSGYPRPNSHTHTAIAESLARTTVSRCHPPSVEDDKWSETPHPRPTTRYMQCIRVPPVPPGRGELPARPVSD
jgi:hypothetical protein